MRLERRLLIYWSRGFFFARNTVSVENPLCDNITQWGGISSSTVLYFQQREEGRYLLRQCHHMIPSSSALFFVNRIFACGWFVMGTLTRHRHLTFMRLYIAGLRRGARHVLSYPTRGQRTWSNARTARHTNTALRRIVRPLQQAVDTMRPLQRGGRLVRIRYSAAAQQAARPWY